MVHKQPLPSLVSSGSGGLWSINPCPLWFIYYLTSALLSTINSTANGGNVLTNSGLFVQFKAASTRKVSTSSFHIQWH